jgi:hypothetical protein
VFRVCPTLARDRAYFETFPDQRMYCRPVLPGESVPVQAFDELVPPVDGAKLMVQVESLHKGRMRHRRFYWAPPFRGTDEMFTEDTDDVFADDRE